MSARVLVIEDDGLTTQTLSRLIADLGAVVGSARSVAEATLSLESERWDCVVLDLLLRDGSSAALIPRLHAIHPRPCLAIVSGSLDLIEPSVIEAFQADALFQKPIHPRELLDWVRSHLPATSTAPRPMRGTDQPYGPAPPRA